MLIGIDASRAFAPERTGTETYSYQLIRHLAEMPESGHRVILYLRKGARIDFKLPPHFSRREVGGDFLWTQLHLSWELLRHPVDVLFVPAHVLPLVHPRRSLAMVHGLEFRHCPECYGRQERWLLEMGTRMNLAFASRLIVPSESTRSDLMNLYGAPAKYLSVIPHGCPEVREGKREVAGRCNLLFIGRIEKRKNLIRLLAAFDQCMQQLEDEEREQVRFVLAGKDGYGAEEIKRRAAASPFYRHLDFLGYVNEEDKQQLLLEADLFLFPSLCEGFGLPVLEAMSCGVPVITSSCGALGEVAGEAALLVDAQDAHQMAAALLSLLRDPSAREELRQRGYERARSFSWQRSAQETWQAITGDRSTVLISE